MRLVDEDCSAVCGWHDVCFPGRRWEVGVPEPWAAWGAMVVLGAGVWPWLRPEPERLVAALLALTLLTLVGRRAALIRLVVPAAGLLLGSSHLPCCQNHRPLSGRTRGRHGRGPTGSGSTCRYRSTPAARVASTSAGHADRGGCGQQPHATGYRENRISDRSGSCPTGERGRSTVVPLGAAASRRSSPTGLHGIATSCVP